MTTKRTTDRNYWRQKIRDHIYYAEGYDRIADAIVSVVNVRVQKETVTADVVIAYSDETHRQNDVEFEKSTLEKQGEKKMPRPIVTYTGPRVKIPKLSRNLETLLRQGVKTAGSYDPVEAMAPVVEEMTSREWDLANKFLTWCVATKTTFGWNLPEVWEKWRTSVQAQAV